jgi:CheY-like chemotaxis protein
MQEKKRILLVDDSSTVLMMERMILGSSTYDFDTARNGREALEKASTAPPDLILMDVMMPEMGGLEACRRLRESEITRDVPIILVTTRGEEESIAMGFEVGCNDYVTKPIDNVELAEKITSLIGS